MAKLAHWVQRNLSLGGIAMNAVKGGGVVVGYSVKGIGYGAAAFARDKVKRARLQASVNDVSEHIGNASSKIGEGVGQVIDATVRVTANVSGKAAGAAARFSGAKEDTARTVERVTTIATAAGIGMVVGIAGTDLLVSALAAPGTFGASVTTSGTSALGGGSIASGGGGLAAGKAIINATTAMTTGSGAAALGSKPEES